MRKHLVQCAEKKLPSIISYCLNLSYDTHSKAYILLENFTKDAVIIHSMYMYIVYICICKYTSYTYMYILYMCVYAM